MRLAPIETRAPRQWAALCCLSVLLLFACLETIHAHPAGDLSRGSNSCVICIAVHANAPALTANPIPVLFTVGTVLAPFRAERKSISADLSVFIRPPPAV